jgi:unspecific peroxygenase
MEVSATISMFSYLLSRVLLATVISSPSLVLAFPEYASSGNVYGRGIEQSTWGPGAVVPGMTPSPLAFSGTKLVHDAAHPYIPPGKGDERGPCPGLNVLANHGVRFSKHKACPNIDAEATDSIFLGVVLPALLKLSQPYRKVRYLVKREQRVSVSYTVAGFNMQNTVARIATYGAHLLNGNLVTDRLSIGGKSRLTGPSPAPPAHAGGINVHNTCEGDASLSRADAYFGDNHNFNETVFNKVREHALPEVQFK